MHEQAIIQSVIDSIRQDLAARKLTGKVKSISLKIGALELHGEESFKQIFAVSAAGTQLEGAELVLTVLPARIKCACGHEGRADEGVDHHSDLPIAECPKCGAVCRVSGGRGVEGIDLEVAEQPARKPRRPAKKS
ncbi:MAG: hydrogenase maturation nickel metallochaperone HypA [Elusimicrobia bacterium]|nr:hydrogenase maturation nickel metallochaperone HypA [Elusimicrobiota bacterium]